MFVYLKSFVTIDRPFRTVPVIITGVDANGLQCKFGFKSKPTETMYDSKNWEPFSYTAKSDTDCWEQSYHIVYLCYELILQCIHRIQ